MKTFEPGTKVCLTEEAFKSAYFGHWLLPDLLYDITRGLIVKTCEEVGGTTVVRVGSDIYDPFTIQVSSEHLQTVEPIPSTNPHDNPTVS